MSWAILCPTTSCWQFWQRGFATHCLPKPPHPVPTLVAWWELPGRGLSQGRITFFPAWKICCWRCEWQILAHHGEESQCPPSPNPSALLGEPGSPSPQKVPRPLYPVWDERVNYYFLEQNVRPRGEVLLSGINQYMEFALVKSQRAGSQHSSHSISQRGVSKGWDILSSPWPSVLLPLQLL